MEQQIINEITSQDSNFNDAMFKSYVDNLFVKLYTSVMLDELPNVKHFMTDEIYQQFQTKIEHLNSQNLRQMYDELNVKSTEIIDAQITEEEFIITVKLISRYLDYLLNKETGDFIRGNTQSRVEKTNILTLTKKRNFLTQNVVRKCPGCGASISVNTKGICDYCGSTYNLNDYEYILSNITTQ